MLDISYLRKNTSLSITSLKRRNIHSSETINKIIDKDNLRKNTQSELDNLLAQANQLAKQIGEFYKNGRQKKAEELKKESLSIKEKANLLQDQYSVLEKDIHDLLVTLPNIPHQTVPSGDSSAHNEIIKESGEIPKLETNAKPHWDLVKTYNLIDFELGNKITGSGFPVYIDKGARLQRSLISYFLDKNIEAGYKEYLPPHLVNKASGFGTGQLPDKDGQMYCIETDNLYLIPTAEVPITNLFRDTILNSKDFPIKATSYTPCFRREAGSYGKDVRGLNRLHQFDKVEIVQIEHPKKSYETLDKMIDHVSSILNELELPYRVSKLCTGDLGFTAALTFDFEVYSAAQEKWLEVSSVSNFENYQANRLRLRYKDKNGKSKLCHTLNGSALALPRIFAALIENNQSGNEIKIPKVLHSYTGFESIK